MKVPCCAALCHAVPCHTVLYRTALYSLHHPRGCLILVHTVQCWIFTLGFQILQLLILAIFNDIHIHCTECCKNLWIFWNVLVLLTRRVTYYGNGNIVPESTPTIKNLSIQQTKGKAIVSYLLYLFLSLWIICWIFWNPQCQSNQSHVTYKYVLCGMCSRLLRYLKYPVKSCLCWITLALIQHCTCCAVQFISST